MIKQAAVTGHTSGLGNSFFRLLSNQGYQVQGFSRTNGYDLRDYSCVTDMLTQIKGFDLFINNAKPDYAQSQIVYR
jgi:dTDP-4-dehydrorhamnose reductase